MTRVTKIFGPPGTGKTTRLLQIAEEAMAAGTLPERIAYMAFTRKAADEAVTRAMDKFKMERDRFPWFRTLHSMGFRDLSMRREDVLSDDHYKELGETLGFQFTSIDDEYSFIPLGTALGDKVARIEALARLRQVSLEDQWYESNERDCPWVAVKQWAQGLRLYKESRGMMDFTDLLENFDAELDVDLFIIDEGQDLSPLQWHVVRKAAANAKQIYLAGDDDQCIYSWAGADVRRFLALKGEVQVLHQSWRLPKKIHAMAQTIVQSISLRQPKEWYPRDDDGAINWLPYESSLDLSKGQWLLLSRNHRFLQRFEQVLMNQGYPYMKEGRHSTDNPTTRAILAWEHLRKGLPATPKDIKALGTVLPLLEEWKPGEDVTMKDLPVPDALKKMNWMDALLIQPERREYIRACLANKESLLAPPRITCSTIHRVKGGQAENVALITDLSLEPWKAKNTDEEQRVLYVGITRAINTLTFIQPQTARHYSI